MKTVGKTSVGRPRKSTSDTQNIETNLEKKTQEKITSMSSNESLTMDFVLKNRKLLEHLKKCKVFLSKSMRNNLFKKYAITNNATNKKSIGKIKSRKKLLSQNGASTSVSSLKDGQNKSTQSPTNKQNPGGRIFIRLPSKLNKKTLPKRSITGGGILNKSKLIKKFGKIVFKCHVRVRRLKKSDPLFKKKFNTNRKSVSFMETVEVFGESDVIYESDESDDSDAIISPVRASTPVKQLKKQNKIKLKKTKIPEKETKKAEAVKNQKLKKKRGEDKTKHPKGKDSTKKTQSPSRKVQNKKPSSPNKRPELTGLKLTQKECFVKLNRSSSIFNTSLTSNDIDAKDTSYDSNKTEVTEPDNLTAAKSDNEDNDTSGDKTDTSHPEENLDVDMKEDEHHEDNTRSDVFDSELHEGEHLSISEESIPCDRTNRREDNKTDTVNSDGGEDHGNVNNEIIDNEGKTSSKAQNEADDVDHDGATCRDNSGVDANKGKKSKRTISKSIDKVNGKESTGVANESDSFHSVNDVNTSDNISESRVSTPVRKSESFETIEQKKRRAVSMSPVLSKSKTNGANTNKNPMTKSSNPDDLFDMLKSDNLPNQPETERRIPSPTRGLSDEEDEGDDAIGTKRTAPSPVPDLLDDSGSANDTRFSLNTFFKSVKDKFLTKRQDNDSSSKSPRKNDATMIDADDNLDSTTTQEISTQ